MYISTQPEQAKQVVNDHLRELFAERRRAAEQIGSSYAAFWRRVEEVAMAGGKRLRPLLTMLGYGKLDEAIVPIAAAQEIVHIAMLMHDDVIDRDTMRHGRQNINGVYQDVYGTYGPQIDTTHFANSAGILAGDAMISEAYRAVQSSSFDTSITRRVSEQLATSIFEVIGGELLDVEAAFRHDQPTDPLAIYRYKTAGYSFIGPLVSGAYCRQAGDQDIERLTQFASNLGVAYQIQDDLLGVFGDEDQTGKSTLSDLREGKQTLLVGFHKQAMNDEQAARFGAFGSETASQAALSQLKDDMQDSGARDQTERAVEEYFAAAVNCLNELSDAAQKSALLTFAHSLRQREV